MAENNNVEFQGIELNGLLIDAKDTKLRSEVNELKQDLTQLETDINKSYKANGSMFMWEQGTRQAGADATSTSRLRLVAKIPKSLVKGIKYKCASGYQATVDLLTSLNVGSDTGWHTEEEVTISSGFSSIRLSRTDNGTITRSECANIEIELIKA